MLQSNVHKTKDMKASSRYFVMPTLYIGIGGYSKVVFPRLDALLHEHYGFRPEPLQLSIFDFDEAQSESSGVDGKKFTTEPYLITLPKKTLKDVSRKLRKKAKIPWIDNLKPYVDLKHVRYAEAPGLNLFPQSGNLAWRLLWEAHVLPELKSKIKSLHPVPQELNDMEGQGFKVSNRSCIWVIAGGGSTTGPTGLIPFVAELKRLKPPETNLFVLVFSPSAYRDKTEAHQTRGRAIFIATMERLLGLFNGKVFEQPYSPNGNYKISLDEDPFDQMFIVDGSLAGGRAELKTEQLGDIVAHFLFKTVIGPLGEHMLGIIGNLNSGLKLGKEDENGN